MKIIYKRTHQGSFVGRACMQETTTGVTSCKSLNNRSWLLQLWDKRLGLGHLMIIFTPKPSDLRSMLQLSWRRCFVSIGPLCEWKYSQSISLYPANWVVFWLTKERVLTSEFTVTGSSIWTIPSTSIVLGHMANLGISSYWVKTLLCNPSHCYLLLPREQSELFTRSGLERVELWRCEGVGGGI